MPKNKLTKTQAAARVQVPAMYLHPQTLKVLDGIAAEMLVSRGVAVDEIVRRYQQQVETIVVQREKLAGGSLAPV